MEEPEDTPPPRGPGYNWLFFFVAGAVVLAAVMFLATIAENMPK